MGYKLITCGEGVIRSEAVSSSTSIVTDFGLVSSCMTFTILMDKTEVHVAHMVISPSGDQLTYSEVLAGIVNIVKGRTISCEIIVAGALLAWQTDLSGPTPNWSPTTISTNTWEAALKLSLEKLLPKADRISTEVYSDCVLYSATFIVEGEVVVQSFNSSMFGRWEQYPKYAPGGWEAARGAIAGKQT